MPDMQEQEVEGGMRTPQQITVFRKNTRTGLAGIYTLSVPAIERRHRTRRANVGYQEEKPMAPPVIKMPPTERVEQLEAKTNYIFNKLKEMQATRKNDQNKADYH